MNEISVQCENYWSFGGHTRFQRPEWVWNRYVDNRIITKVVMWLLTACFVLSVLAVSAQGFWGKDKYGFVGLRDKCLILWHKSYLSLGDWKLTAKIVPYVDGQKKWLLVSFCNIKYVHKQNNWSDYQTNGAMVF